MRYTDEDDSLLGLEQAQRGRRAWTGRLRQRVRVSKQLPLAVFKISGRRNRLHDK